MSPEPPPSASCHNLGLGSSLLDQLGNTTLSQSYLNLIDDSVNHHEEQECSDEGSILLGAGGASSVGGGRGSEMNQTTDSVKPVVGASEKRPFSNGHVMGHPPDIVLGTLPSKTVPRTSLELDLGANWDKEVNSSGANGRSKVKHGHSRTWQRNVHCLETEV